MKFIFIRHGKDDGNYRGGWSNQNIISEGREQAYKLGKYLEENKESLNIRKFVVSDLKRAVTTANIANEALKLPVELEPKLREMNNGDLAGMSNDDALDKYPGLFFNTLGMNEKYPNGESPLDFYNRIKDWFNETIDLYKDEDGNIAFVTHSGVINIIYYIVKKLEWTNKEKSFKIDNCSIHIFDLSKMDFDVENYREYLK
jgi:broad specificity phosphatase PhoE